MHAYPPRGGASGARGFLRGALVAASALLFAASAWGGEPGESLRIAKALSEAYADVAERVSPAVVAIETERRIKIGSDGVPRIAEPGSPEQEMFEKLFEQDPTLRERLKQGLGAPVANVGSGVIIDAQGHVVTNNHVVEGADKVRVRLKDERVFEATIIGLDPKTDLAVIKLREVDATLPTARMGDSRRLRPGNIVLAIGSPFGLNQTLTAGIVSAVGRNRLGGGQLRQVMYQDFIQTDASINRGNSGGPLINLDGEVIGINSAIATGSSSTGSDGVGFAIPSALVQEIVPQLIRDGKVTRGWLGISISDLTPAAKGALQQALGVGRGVAVNGVDPKGPAGAGGILAGDVILSFDGQTVENVTQLQRIVARTPVGRAAPTVVARDGARKELSITIGQQPEDIALGAPLRLPSEEEGQAASSQRLGVLVRAFEGSLVTQFPQHEGVAGVMVIRVSTDGPADKAGVRAGDLILEVDGKKTPTPEAFTEAVAGLEEAARARIMFRQGETNRLATLQFEAE